MVGRSPAELDDCRSEMESKDNIYAWSVCLCLCWGGGAIY